MQDETNVAKSARPDAAKTGTPPQGEPVGRRRADRNTEPLLVELAWLVIEGAVLFRRVRAILARI